MKLLYIKATPKSVENSWTLKMSEFFLSLYCKQHPQHTITELTLNAANTPYLSESDLSSMVLEDKGEFANTVDQFLAHDKYIIAAPFWNLSIPAVLRAYIDRIITVGKTFTYTDTGPQPLHAGRKAVFFMARGAYYTEGASIAEEFGLSYWNAMSDRFLGLKNQAVLLEGTELLSKDELANAFEEKKKAIAQIALEF